MKQCVIFCGGKGTRLGDLAKETQKCLLPVRGIPVLRRTIDFLRGYGFGEFILLAGHLGLQVREAFSKTPGVRVLLQLPEIGTGKRIALARQDGCLSSSMMVMCGDLVIDFDVNAMAKKFRSDHLAALLITRQSDHPESSLLVKTYSSDDSRLAKLYRLQGTDKREPFINQASTGVAFCRKEVIPTDCPDHADFFQDILGSGFKGGKHQGKSASIAGVQSIDSEREFIRDMGTLEGLRTCELYLANKERVRAAKPAKPWDIVFLDRDGILCSDIEGGIYSPTQINIDAVTLMQIQKLSRAGLRLFVVTNQPVVAKGLCPYDTVRAIHEYMEDVLAGLGINIAGWYFCPHHPETHHRVQIAGYSKACMCRKPRPGLILQATQEHSLDLNHAVMVGDSWRDIGAAQQAGIASILVKDGPWPAKYVARRGIDHHVTNIADAVSMILNSQAVVSAAPPVPFTSQVRRYDAISQ